MLACYYERFDTVELNNSFYMLPKIETLASWQKATPNDFEFAIKASRFLTHNKKLKEPENALNNFLPRAEALGKKLGPILFQLPPKWRVNVERLAEFLDALPKYHHYTLEFREPSWLVGQIYELLRKHNAAFCIYELAGLSLSHRAHCELELHSPPRSRWKVSGKLYQQGSAHLGQSYRRMEHTAQKHLRLLRQRPSRICRIQCAHSETTRGRETCYAQCCLTQKQSATSVA